MASNIPRRLLISSSFGVSTLHSRSQATGMHRRFLDDGISLLRHLGPCHSSSSNTSELTKPSCRSCWLVCEKAWFPQSNAIPNDSRACQLASSTPLPTTDAFILLTSPGAGVRPIARESISRSSSSSGLNRGDEDHTDRPSSCK